MMNLKFSVATLLIFTNLGSSAFAGDDGIRSQAEAVKDAITSPVGKGTISVLGIAGSIFLVKSAMVVESEELTRVTGEIATLHASLAIKAPEIVEKERLLAQAIQANSIEEERALQVTYNSVLKKMRGAKDPSVSKALTEVGGSYEALENTLTDAMQKVAAASEGQATSILVKQTKIRDAEEALTIARLKAGEQAKAICSVLEEKVIVQKSYKWKAVRATFGSRFMKFVSAGTIAYFAGNELWVLYKDSVSPRVANLDEIDKILTSLQKQRM